MGANILKKIAIILLVLLISLISFAGFYVKELNRMVNAIPEYKVGMDFGETREIRLDIGDHVETKYYDENGNEVENNDDGTATAKEIPENPEDVLTRRKL